MSAKRVLITGAAGFVGANLAVRLMREGHDLHLLVRSEGDPWRLTAAQVDAPVHRLDLADATRVKQVVAAVRPDWVFHLAAYGNSAWHADRQRMVNTNISGTMNLLDACGAQGVEALVHSGSSSEYGFKNHAAFEDERADPSSPYAVTKLAATQYCAYVARTSNLRIVTLRLYSVFGPMEEPARLVPSLVMHGLRQRYPPLANPTSGHDFVYVDDVVEAFVRAAGHESCRGGEIFNVASGRSVSLREIVDVTRAVLEVPGQPVWGSFPSRSWDTTVWAGDITHISERLHWQPTHSLEQGIRAFIHWFNGHPEIQDRYLRAIR